MHELIVNLHNHTRYSDGTGTHKEIGKAAVDAGLDVIILTDHNVYVKGIDQYLRNGNHTLLLLAGEEIHDQDRQPQKSHLLVLNANTEMTQFAIHPQGLIDEVNHVGGLAFIAHPYEKALPLFKEDDISWDNWEVSGNVGIELWNGMSEYKNRIKNYLSAIFLAFFPQFIAHHPEPEALSQWDRILKMGRKMVAVAGSDSHAMHMHLGPIHRVVFPYDFHFHALNNHILVENPLTGDLSRDKRMVFDSLGKGNTFIGYDLPYPTYGFRYYAESEGQTAQMGGTLQYRHGFTLQIRLPDKTECLLLKDGELVQKWHGQEIITHLSNQPGVYRVECYRQYLGARRGWIFSNPITLEKKNRLV